MSDWQTDDGDVWKGLLAGALGGLTASWVMTLFQARVPAATFATLLGETQQDGGDGGEPATVEAAEALSETVFGHALTEREKKVAGPGVHYALGTSAGALYGALSETAPWWPSGPGSGHAVPIMF